MRSSLRVFLAVTLGLIASVAVADQYGSLGGGIATGILDGLIVNADVNAAANITATKLGTGAVDNTEFNLLNGHAAALVDTDDAVATAITGTGALGAGSIAAGFGAIDNGADNITTTGTVAAGAVTANGTVTHNGVATDVACGAGETWTNTCANATFSTGKVTVPTLATTVSDFLAAARSDTAGLAMSTGGAVLATIVPAQSITVTRVVLSVVSGAGTGSQIITFTDGTNTCTCTVACPYTTASVSCVAGAGTGCTYAPAAVVTATVTTQCTTSQPTARSIATFALKN